MHGSVDFGRAGATEDFITEVNCLLDQLIQRAPESDEPFPAATAPLITEVHRLLQSGGKRLRPRFLDLGYRAAGGKGRDHLLAAAALELLHTFALLQDDVMDGSVIRRGRPTAGVSLGQLAPKSPPGTISGGQSLAVLASDLALIMAEQALRRLEVLPERMRLSQHYWDMLRYELAAGQALDLMLTGSPPWKEGDVLQVADFKSGRYTVLRPLQIGAALAGWSGILAEQWGMAALPVGIAFQIQDDLLALAGNPEETGKDGAEDIRSGKATLPMALGFQRATPPQESLLRRVVGNPAATVEEILQVLEVLEETRALRSARSMVGQLFSFGAKQMNQLKICPEVRAELEQMLGDLARRMK
ncbi:MAG: polyprenyl synthetase family protein [Bacillota bacterium]